jgi:hypothetical protein
LWDVRPVQQGRLAADRDEVHDSTDTLGTTGGRSTMTQAATEKAQAAKGAAAETAATARDEAAGVKEQAIQSGTQVAATAKEQGAQVVAEAANQARDLIGEVRGQATTQAAAQRDRAVGGLRDIANELESMVNGQGAQGGIASELARQASSRAHDIASWIESREPADILEDVKDFARRRPGTFLLGAAIAGVLAGRATRSGVAAAHESSGGGRPGAYAPDTQRAYASSTPVTDAYATTGSGYGTTSGYSTTTGYPETGYPEAVTPLAGGVETGGATATTSYGTTTGYAEDVYTAGSTGTGFAPGTMDPPLETVDVRDETTDAASGYASGSAGGYGGQQR